MEQRVLETFLQTSDSIGLHLPEDTQALRSLLENWHIIPERWPPDTILSLMALAQHHGVPTRLLDWSRHPLKAALFAARGAARLSDSEGRLSVWALFVEKLDMIRSKELAPPFTVLTAPAATNSNLRAQEGVFTLGKRIKAGDQSPVDRTPFDQMLAAWIRLHKIETPGPWFQRITLPKAEAEDLSFQLSLEGITQASLFPDFHGVVDTMKDFAHWQGAEGPGRKRAAAFISGYSVSSHCEIDLPQLLGKRAAQLTSFGQNLDGQEHKFSFIDSLIEDSFRQHIILMHEFTRELPYLEDRPTHIFEIESNYGASAGAFQVRNFYTRLIATQFVSLKPEDPSLTLTATGHEFAEWLISQGRKAAFMNTPFGSWGTPAANGPIMKFRQMQAKQAMRQRQAVTEVPTAQPPEPPLPT